jgi:hypothetical protein
MTEKELIKLGFEKHHGDLFYYYVYSITRKFSLISSANDELIDGEWQVEMFEEPEIKFTDFNEVKTLIELLKLNIR